MKTGITCFILGCCLGGLLAGLPDGTASDPGTESGDGNARQGVGVPVITRPREREPRIRPEAGGASRSFPEDPVDLMKQALRASPAERMDLAEKLRFADADLGVMGRYALYMAWAQENPSEALDVAITDPDPAVREMIFERWAETDLLGAAGRFSENPYVLHPGGSPNYGGSSGSVGVKLYERLLRENETGANEWVESLPTELKSKILNIRENEAKNRERLESLPPELKSMILKER